MAQKPTGQHDPDPQGDPVANPERDRQLQTDRGSRATIFVACKFPLGIHLQLFKFDTRQVPVLGGGGAVRDEQVPTRLPERHTIDGPALDRGPNPRRKWVVGGYAITEGIPLDFWKAWYEQNKDSSIVQNGMVMAHETRDGIEGAVKERRGLRSNLEPMSQEKDPRAKGRQVERGNRNADDDAA